MAGTVDHTALEDAVAAIPPLPVVPSPNAPDELRVVTKSDLKEHGDQIRREMKLYLGLGVAAGNVAAALVASYFGPSRLSGTATALVQHLFS